MKAAVYLSNRRRHVTDDYALLQRQFVQQRSMSRLATPEIGRRAKARTSSLLQRLNLAGSPSFVEPRLERAVEAQERVPSFAGDGLHPIILLAGRRIGPEIDVN